MIDFHSHILPNIDDGSRSIEETFNLIKEAEKAGFESVISTSHYMENYYETDVPEREVWVKAILENLKTKNINTNLYLGNEIYFTDNIIELLEKRKASTINDTSYVLFELPLNAEPMNLYDVVYDMLQYKLVPILAHPERYSFVQKEPDLIYDLIEKGVLMQANYGSIVGQYGEKAQMIVRRFFDNVTSTFSAPSITGYTPSFYSSSVYPNNIYRREYNNFLNNGNRYLPYNNSYYFNNNYRNNPYHRYYNNTGFNSAIRNRHFNPRKYNSYYKPYITTNPYGTVPTDINRNFATRSTVHILRD